MHIVARFSAVALTVALATICGCGGRSKTPELAPVSGQVKLGGNPLPKATVNFIPENGRPSTGITDDSGNYDLQYTADQRGAMIGKHSVRISTFRAADDDEGTARIPESVPAKYNVKSELKQEVKSGDNEINFDLPVDGPVVQPDAADPRRRRDDCGGEESSEVEATAEYETGE